MAAPAVVVGLPVPLTHREGCAGRTAHDTWKRVRYLKATLICGALTVLFVAGLFELHAFARLDASLANFLGRPSPPVVERPLQYFLVLLISAGIAWTTIDLNRIALKLGIVLAALAETVAAVWVANLHGAFFRRSRASPRSSWQRARHSAFRGAQPGGESRRCSNCSATACRSALSPGCWKEMRG